MRERNLIRDKIFLSKNQYQFVRWQHLAPKNQYSRQLKQRREGKISGWLPDENYRIKQTRLRLGRLRPKQRLSSCKLSFKLKNHPGIIKTRDGSKHQFLDRSAYLDDKSTISPLIGQTRQQKILTVLNSLQCSDFRASTIFCFHSIFFAKSSQQLFHLDWMFFHCCPNWRRMKIFSDEKFNFCYTSIVYSINL